MLTLNIKLERTYLQESFYNANNVPDLVKRRDPKFSNKFDVDVAHKQLPEANYYSVSLSLIATLFAQNDDKSKEEIYKTKVIQVGIFLFTHQGLTEENIVKVLEVDCAGKLYPEACKTMNFLMKQGSLPVVPLLQSFDFYSMYAKKHDDSQRRLPSSSREVDLLTDDANYLLEQKKYQDALSKFRQAFVLANKNNLEVEKEDIRNSVEGAIKLCVDDDSAYALRIAAFWGELDLLKEMIENIKDINVVGKTGNGALHFAVMSKINSHCKLDVIKLLIENGADPNLSNNSKKTPKDYSTDEEVLQILNSDKKSFVCE